MSCLKFLFEQPQNNNTQQQNEPAEPHWSSSATIEQVLDKPEWTSEFTEFLQKQHCEESLLFILQVRQLQELSESDELETKITNIFKTFVNEDSDQRIHVSFETHSEIIARIKKKDFSTNIFNKAASEIFFNLKTDNFVRFKMHHLPQNC